MDMSDPLKFAVPGPTYTLTFVRQSDRVKLDEWQTPFPPLVPQPGAIVWLGSDDKPRAWEVKMLWHYTPCDVRVDVDHQSPQRRDK